MKTPKSVKSLGNKNAYKDDPKFFNTHIRVCQRRAVSICTLHDFIKQTLVLSIANRALLQQMHDYEFNIVVYRNSTQTCQAIKHIETAFLERFVRLALSRFAQEALLSAHGPLSAEFEDLGKQYNTMRTFCCRKPNICHLKVI